MKNFTKMTAAAQKLVLTVPTSKMEIFMEILRKVDFVKVESLEEIIRRYIRTAPKKPKLSYDEIADILMEIRYQPAPKA